MPASARGRLDAGLRLLDAITVEVGWADGDLRQASPATTGCGGGCPSLGSGW
jgi:hypothetical protein